MSYYIDPLIILAELETGTDHTIDDIKNCKILCDKMYDFVGTDGINILHNNVNSVCKCKDPNSEPNPIPKVCNPIQL